MGGVREGGALVERIFFDDGGGIGDGDGGDGGLLEGTEPYRLHRVAEADRTEG